MKQKLFILLIGIAFMGCSGDKQTEELDKPLENNVKQGVNISYNDDGSKRQEKRYIDGELYGVLKNYFGNGKVKEVAFFYKDDQLCWGEFNQNGEPIIEDFFINIDIPEVIKQGSEVNMDIQLFNKSVFADCFLLAGEFVNDGKDIVIGEKELIKEDNIIVGLPTDKAGLNYWTGTISCDHSEDSTLYAAYPIYLVYEVE